MRFCSFLAILSVAWMVELSAYTYDWDVDSFGNNIEAGQVIDNEYSNWGLNIDVDNFVRSHDLGIAFDSENPTGGDWDLETGGSTGHDPYGNILIISENNTDSNGDGLIDTPDDEASQNGAGYSGMIDFQFDYVGVEGTMTLLDIEESDHELRFFLDGIWLSSETIYITPGGDSNLILLTFGGFQFDQIQYWAGGSGAIAEMSVQVPEPTTLLLMSTLGSAVVGLGMRKKRLEKEDE